MTEKTNNPSGKFQPVKFLSKIQTIKTTTMGNNVVSVNLLICPLLFL